MSSDIALTQTVQKGGCAAKVSAVELRSILSQIKFPAAHADLLVDGRYFDDAGIYRVTDEIAMVQTLDFFTPILDTPKLFGMVAATNALSDVYAMGGRPKTAMGILAFPLATMSSEVIVQVMQGASDKVAEANANFVGGHSIDDDTLKFGLSVTGFVHPKKIWSNAGAKPGDHLILTKPLGTGTLTAALKRRELTEAQIGDAVKSMSTLNNVIDFLTEVQALAIHAATDITGFGFSGHAMQMAKASGVTFHIHTSKLPVFSEALKMLEKGFLTKAHKSNQEYTNADIALVDVSPMHQLLMHDPQTSGGLLLSVDPKQSATILAALSVAFPATSLVGSVAPTESRKVVFN
jgi:selenide,water dikinase